MIEGIIWAALITIFCLLLTIGLLKSMHLTKALKVRFNKLAGDYQTFKKSHFSNHLIEALECEEPAGIEPYYKSIVPDNF